MVKGRNVYRVLVGTLGRSRHRWEDNFKVDLQEVGWWDMNWIVVAQDRDRW
jgi:hypothetical protein